MVSPDMIAGLRKQRNRKTNLNAIADLSVVTLGTAGTSMSAFVVDCISILKRHGLRTNIHALGTNIEGDLDTVLASVAACHRHLHEIGVARVVVTLKITTRTDREQTLEEKIGSVKKRMNRR